MPVVFLAGCRTETPGLPDGFKTDAYQQGVETKGIMARADYERLLRINNTIQRSSTISDDDLKFALGILKTPPLSASMANGTDRQNLVLLCLSGKKNVTPDQSDQLYLNIIEIAQDGQKELRVPATQVICSTQDSRKSGMLQGLKLSTRDPDVQNAVDACR